MRELREMFAQASLAVTDLNEIGIPESPVEDGLEKYDTFEANALAKARYFMMKSGGLPTVADDSGLVVDALGGLPGVKSKRWSGRTDLTELALDNANNAKLIRELEAIEFSAKGAKQHLRFPFTARYVCAAVYVDRLGEIATTGQTTGVIIRTPRGTNGFGYDPYFESEAVNGTFGEATMEQKSRVSHRGRAFRSLIETLRLRGLAR
jgi:XTP/dITP diphosphohydrolase